MTEVLSAERAEARMREALARELQVRTAQVEAALALLDDGATVPFVARYRKEATGGMSDEALRKLAERSDAIRKVNAERSRMLAHLLEKGVLTEALREKFESTQTLSDLREIYAPYAEKRKTAASRAAEAGLAPLAEKLLSDRTLDPAKAALAFLNPEAGIDSPEAALDGARDILAERFSLDMALRAELRALYASRAVVSSRVVEGKEAQGQKYRDYFELDQEARTLSPHRTMALLRGEREGFLKLSAALPETDADRPLELIGRAGRIGGGDAWLLSVCGWTWRVRLRHRLADDLWKALSEKAEAAAVGIFGKNLHDLLLAAPLGQKMVLGLDPGFRTGVKSALIDATGKLLGFWVLDFHTGERHAREAEARLEAILRKYPVDMIALGNGTASRETAEAVRRVLPRIGRPVGLVTVSEAGASVYSASELAAKEFPDLDVVYRGAVSIARRLQDPLAELVKIDPKAIGVGQYQHDVSSVLLGERLDAVVEDCVNFVGVNLNTASEPLLARVSGLGPVMARRIVAWREANGAFRSRKDLLRVPGLGAKRFLQCAGFLRVKGGENPLDDTGVHPEAYPVVERILKKTALPIEKLMGNGAVVGRLRASDFADEAFGLPTVADILRELEKPGLDPRSDFRTANFESRIRSIEDLRPGMELEGTVSNVAAFGAFVDIGIHDDGLVHISEMSERRVNDPHDVVHVGQVVRVRVVEVDVRRRRVALSMRPAGRPRQGRTPERRETAMGRAFAALRR